MWNFCKACAAICCDCDLWEPIMQVTKDFVSSEKKQSSKQKNTTMTLGKSLFLRQYRMRFAIYILLNTKDHVINLSMVAYGNQQNAITLAQANNSDCLRALKHYWKPGFKATWCCQAGHVALCISSDYTDSSRSGRY